MALSVVEFSREGYKIDFESQILALFVVFDTSPLHQFSKFNDFI